MDNAIHFTDFDYVIIAVMVFSCIFAFFRGLVREILSLAAWVGAGIITIYYFPSAAAKLQQHFKNPTVAAAIAGVGIYLACLIGFGMLNMVIIKSFKKGSESGMLDNMLGLVFGAARGALMVSLAFFLITVALPEKEYPDWLKQSVTRPYLAKGAAVLAKAAPEYMHDISLLQKKAQDEVRRDNAPVVPYDADNPENNAQNNTRNNTNANPPVNTTANPGSSGNNGYSRTTTQQLDRLIQSTGTP